jgi:hypothetical protein
MNKKLITALVALTLVLPTTATASAKNNISNKTVQIPTIAILDTGIDTSLPMFKDKVIHEACVVQWSSCPNGMSVMEGAGSATLKTEWLATNGFNHGTEMASLAVKTNANINIVFVKVIGTNAKGFRQAAGEATVYNALEWVIQNKTKFNIMAVSMSQGHHNLIAGTDYCPKTPITESKINTLNSMDVGVFFPTGNTRDYSRIDWPACIPSAIAVGATMPAHSVAIYSNHDPLLTDFFALGNTRAVTVGGKEINVAGTSAANVIAATSWATIKAAKPSLTYSQIYDLISRTSTPTRNSRVDSGKLINLEAALNG